MQSSSSRRWVWWFANHASHDAIIAHDASIMIDKHPEQSRDIEIAQVFFTHYRSDVREFIVPRDDMQRDALKRTSSVPMLVRIFRTMRVMPEIVDAYADDGCTWEINDHGPEHYCFTMVQRSLFIPDAKLPVTYLYDQSNPCFEGIARPCEQTLLQTLDENRVYDFFLGGARLWCIARHMKLATTELDAVYSGQDSSGRSIIVPVEAKRNDDHLNSVQLKKYFEACENKFAGQNVRVVGVHRNEAADWTTMFEFERSNDNIRVVREMKYRLIRRPMMQAA